jgi:hypothetical protein
MPLPPGAQIQLTLNDPYYVTEYSRVPAVIPAGSTVYVQVDSANTAAGYGAVLDGHEEAGQPYNNISSLMLTGDTPTEEWQRAAAAAGDTQEIL